MRTSALAFSAALLASVSLAACGNEPEPVAPVDPSFDRTSETTDTDVNDPLLPDGTEAPTEIPEIMEEVPGTGDTTTESLPDPEVDPIDPAEPVEELGTPQ